MDGLHHFRREYMYSPTLLFWTGINYCPLFRQPEDVHFCPNGKNQTQLQVPGRFLSHSETKERERTWKGIEETNRGGKEYEQESIKRIHVRKPAERWVTNRKCMLSEIFCFWKCCSDFGADWEKEKKTHGNEKNCGRNSKLSGVGFLEFAEWTVQQDFSLRLRVLDNHWRGNDRSKHVSEVVSQTATKSTASP